MTKKFRGVYTVMITPLDEHGAVDLKALATFTDWLHAEAASFRARSWALRAPQAA